MTAWWRVATILTRGIVHVVIGLLLVSLMFPWCTEPARQGVMRWWSRRLLSIHRVDLSVLRGRVGADRADVVDAVMRPGGKGAMLVMNHVSWLDIFVVYALRPPHFIAKAEIARWPVLGYLVGRSGTLFIERGKRHAVRDINRRVGALLGDGELVGLFPEGTVTDGHRLLPFHGNLIQAAIDVHALVVVAAIRYRTADGGPTTATLYTEGIDFLRSIIRIARLGPVVAELHLLDALPTDTATRHDIARDARASIARALELADDPAALSSPGTEPGTRLDPRAGSP